jgi:hypothetical protein
LLKEISKLQNRNYAYYKLSELMMSREQAAADLDFVTRESNEAENTTKKRVSRL